MSQYRKGVHNLAPGLGEAIADPREAEARAREASARAERELGSQIQSRMEATRLQQQAQELQGQQQLASQFHQQQTRQQQGSQFDKELEARSQQAQAQREFQQQQQWTQLDSQESGQLLQADLQREQMQQQGLQSDRSYDLQRQQQSDQNYNSDRSFSQQGNQFDRQMQYQSGRDVSTDKYQNAQLGLQQQGQANSYNLGRMGLQQGDSQFEAKMNANLQGAKMAQHQAEMAGLSELATEFVGKEIGAVERKMLLAKAALKGPGVAQKMQLFLDHSPTKIDSTSVDSFINTFAKNLDEGKGLVGSWRQADQSYEAKRAPAQEGVPNYGAPSYSSLPGQPGYKPSGGGMSQGGGYSSGQMTGRGSPPQGGGGGFQQVMANPGSYNPSPGVPMQGDPYNTGALSAPARGSFGDWNSPPPLDPGVATEANRPRGTGPGMTAYPSTFDGTGAGDFFSEFDTPRGDYGSMGPPEAPIRSLTSESNWQRMMQDMSLPAGPLEGGTAAATKANPVFDSLFSERSMWSQDYSASEFEKDVKGLDLGKASALLSSLPVKERTEMAKLFGKFSPKEFEDFYAVWNSRRK